MVVGVGDLTFKILKAFLFYYSVHSANINQNLWGFFLGGGIFCATDTFSVYYPSVTMPGFGSLVSEVRFSKVILIVVR